MDVAPDRPQVGVSDHQECLSLTLVHPTAQRIPGLRDIPIFDFQNKEISRKSCRKERQLRDHSNDKLPYVQGFDEGGNLLLECISLT